MTLQALVHELIERKVDLSVDNAPGDAFTKVLVQIARHQYRSSKVAF